MHICNQRAYLLTQLKRQGLPLAQLQQVFDSIILARLLYALRGYLSSTDINCLQQFLDKAKRWHITACNYSIDELLNKCDISMFTSSLMVDHCLNHIYVSKQHHTHCMILWQRGHNFERPKLKYQTARSSFINRSLFNYV